MVPLLLDVPDQIRTARLTLRAPRLGDGATILPAVRASLPELKVWMPWATDEYGIDDAEQWCRRTGAKSLTREELGFLLFLHGGEHVGNIGLFNFNWDVPRCEVGYWLATPHCGQGLMGEAVEAVFALARDACSIQRMEIRCDDRNVRSWRVAERCGFQLEGVLRRESLATDGALRDTRVYARLAPESA